ncbi:TPA: hypothetical protein DF272_00285 [Candidatus Falkowbacteria bacterium]|nr:hypothetical protein [Candidatus Falkowbacteria bacterium]
MRTTMEIMRASAKTMEEWERLDPPREAPYATFASKEDFGLGGPRLKSQRKPRHSKKMSKQVKNRD